VFKRLILTICSVSLLFVSAKAQESDSLNFAFINAVFDDDIDKALSLLELGADINYSTQGQASAIHYSIANNNKTMMLMLLQKGADVEKMDQYGNTPLILATGMGEDSLMFHLMMNDADVNRRNFRGEKSLHLAVLSGNPIALDMLLFYDADPNPADDDSITPLHLAAYNGLDLMIEILLSYNANPDIPDKNGLNACFYSVLGGHPNSLILLLDAGCDVFRKNKIGVGLLELAMSLGQYESSTIILEKLEGNVAEKKDLHQIIQNEVNIKRIWKTALKSDSQQSKALLKQYKIQRPLVPVFGHINYQLMFTGFSDFYSCFGVQMTEVNYGLHAGLSFGTRLWRNRVLTGNNADTILQLHEYRGFIQSEVLKYIPLKRFHDRKARLDVVFGMRFPFTWANYSAMKMKENFRGTYAPVGGVEYIRNKTKFSLLYQYWDYDNRNFSRHLFTLGFSFR
jgi:ankyrin repeat protein